MQNKAIEVIRHSLNAANAALDLLSGSEQPVSEVAVEVAAAPAPSTAPAELTKFAVLMNELHDPRFKLRTVAELADKVGIMDSEVYGLLDIEEISYVTKTRRSDNAPLIGLSSRNQ